MRVSSKNHETSSKSISQHNFDRRSLNFSRHGIHTRGTQAHTSVRRIHRWWCFDSTNDFPSRVAGEKPLAIGRVSLCVNRRFEFRETQSAFVRTHNGPLSAQVGCRLARRLRRRTKVQYAAVRSDGIIAFDYVIRRLNALSAGSEKPVGRLNLR